MRRLATTIIMVANSLGFLDAYGFLRERLFEPQATILMYHRVGKNLEPRSGLSIPVTPEVFEEQMNYLRSRYKIMSLDELAMYVGKKKSLPKKIVSITFDDGYKDNYLYAYPILRKYNIPATIFLATGYIDTASLFWWDRMTYCIQNTKLGVLELDVLGAYPLKSTRDRLIAESNIKTRLIELSERKKCELIENLENISGVNIPDSLGREVILSWDEIKEMSGNGITFGAHTVTHPILTRLPMEEAKEEIVKSKLRIEEEIGKSVSLFCYPEGRPWDYNEEIKQNLKGSGFICAVTSVPRLVGPRDDPCELGRIWAGWDLETLKFLIEIYPDITYMFSKIRRS